MSSGELLGIEPLELTFPFELKKQISCSLQLSNKTEDYVAFKVKTTNPKKYCVRPNTGVVLPHSTSDIIVTMQAQKEAPADLQCKDKFLVQSVTVSPGSTLKDITAEMEKRGGMQAEGDLCGTASAPSPVPEGSEEGSSPRPSVSDNGTLNVSELHAPQRLTLLSKLTGEKNSVIQQNIKLQQELELLRRERRKHSAHWFSLTAVVIVAILDSSLRTTLRHENLGASTLLIVPREA
ncbi:unnamed protein product [Spirodela intermedia]|uniref:MSP domain-containing protein n=1 Tax=Spirodela intermedia TaxID=51605 RepID=A0A7I8IFR8_SPIIN|nr:unnamed protein product [Spirodela intermedia]CAA6656134.1 unnamed protein product [Spirodela intermedia]